MDHRVTDTRCEDAGVTLIELIVVVAILAVLGIGVGLVATQQNASRAVASDLAWFQTRFEEARALAVTGRMPTGLYLSRRDLATARYNGTSWSAPDAARRWRAGVNFQPLTSADFAQTAPNIVALPSGQTTAFVITFAARGQGARRCETNGWSGLTCDAP